MVVKTEKSLAASMTNAAERKAKPFFSQRPTVKELVDWQLNQDKLVDQYQLLKQINKF